ncbi:MAG: hypothetical protein GMKNLPBB_03255 [Myxococcota bacterium]|nr:hypothetical protein [Myxococcota bacterium]
MKPGRFNLLEHRDGDTDGASSPSGDTPGFRRNIELSALPADGSGAAGNPGLPDPGGVLGSALRLEMPQDLQLDLDAEHPESVACRTCGAVNPWGSHYCFNCGTELHRPAHPRRAVHAQGVIPELKRKLEETPQSDEELRRQRAALLLQDAEFTRKLEEMRKEEMELEAQETKGIRAARVFLGICGTAVAAWLGFGPAKLGPIVVIIFVMAIIAVLTMGSIKPRVRGG